MVHRRDSIVGRAHRKRGLKEENQIIHLQMDYVTIYLVQISLGWEWEIGAGRSVLTYLYMFSYFTRNCRYSSTLSQASVSGENSPQVIPASVLHSLLRIFSGI